MNVGAISVSLSLFLFLSLSLSLSLLAIKWTQDHRFSVGLWGKVFNSSLGLRWQGKSYSKLNITFQVYIFNEYCLCTYIILNSPVLQTRSRGIYSLCELSLSEHQILQYTLLRILVRFISPRSNLSMFTCSFKTSRRRIANPSPIIIYAVCLSLMHGLCYGLGNGAPATECSSALRGKT